MVVPVAPSSIPITVFTGFLGAGKTSIILSLLPRLPPGYKVVLLKNEFGDVEGYTLMEQLIVDSQLAKQSSLTAVNEILNGCLCCVLVGRMKSALLEIREKFRPDRIIVECSGSAFPATLAFQIRELERETNYDLRLDAILTVIDAENFTGYEDSSPTARMQASYTDLIIINKWEHISERALDILIDHLNTLNDLTPKVRCEGRNGVDPSLIFGLDSKLYLEKEQVEVRHHDEVETATVLRGQSLLGKKPNKGPSDHTHDHGTETPCTCSGNHDRTLDTHDIPPRERIGDEEFIDEGRLTNALASLSKETIYRVKGFLKTEKGLHILNWAFGRYDLTPFDSLEGDIDVVKLTIMGERGEVKRAGRRLAEGLGAILE